MSKCIPCVIEVYCSIKLSYSAYRIMYNLLWGGPLGYSEGVDPKGGGGGSPHLSTYAHFVKPVFANKGALLMFTGYQKINKFQINGHATKGGGR